MSGDEMESWYWSELLDLAPDDVHEEVMRRVELLEAENSELKRLLDEAKQELADVLTRPENADQANGRLIMALDEFRAFYQRKLSEAGIAPND